MHRIHSILNRLKCTGRGSSPGRSGARLAILGAAAVALLVGTAQAQSVPSNNTCSGARQLGWVTPYTGVRTVTGTTLNATNDGSTTCGSSNASPDVWYNFLADGDPITIDTCGSTFDTVVSVHTGCPGNSGNTVACNDNAATGNCAGSVTSSMTFNTQLKTAYRIRVSGNNNASGPFTLRIAAGTEIVIPPPANDRCINATWLGTCPNGTFAYTTAGATTEGPTDPPMGDCFYGINHDVWFSFTAHTNGVATANTCASTVGDSVIGVYSGSCTMPTPIACNDNTCGARAAVSFNVTAGATYMIRVGISRIHNGLIDAPGTLTISSPLCPPPPPPVPSNNNCSAATNLGGLADYDALSVTGTTVNATTDGSTSCSSYPSPDVWYRFNAKGPATITFDTCGSTFDTVLSAHSGCPGTAANTLACNDNATTGGCAGSPTSSITFNVNGDTTYYIRVAGRNVYTGEFTLRYIGPRSGFDDRPSNDLCSSARSVSYGTRDYTTIGALTDGPAGLMGDCYYEMQNDVWFRFTACTTGVVTARTCINTIWDTMLSVYTGSCSAPTLIACNDEGCGVQSTISFNATAGVAYLIRVGINPNTPYQGPGTLTISGPACPPPPPPPPTNNACSAATDIGNFDIGTLTRTITGTTAIATNDGATSCGASNASPDVWYRFSTGHAGLMYIDSCGSTFDTVISLHSACSGSAANTLVCSDNNTNYGPCPGGTSSFIAVNVASHANYLIRVSGNNNVSGPFTLHVAYANGLVGGPEGCPCDWDHDGALTSSDFFAFLNGFMGGTADFNNSGDVTSQDLFDYLDCFMTVPGLCAS